MAVMLNPKGFNMFDDSTYNANGNFWNHFDWLLKNVLKTDRKHESWKIRNPNFINKLQSTKDNI